MMDDGGCAGTSRGLAVWLSEIFLGHHFPPEGLPTEPPRHGHVTNLGSIENTTFQQLSHRAGPSSTSQNVAMIYSAVEYLEETVVGDNTMAGRTCPDPLARKAGYDGFWGWRERMPADWNQPLEVMTTATMNAKDTKSE